MSTTNLTNPLTISLLIVFFLIIIYYLVIFVRLAFYKAKKNNAYPPASIIIVAKDESYNLKKIYHSFVSKNILMNMKY